MEIIEIDPKEEDQQKLGELEYGTLFKWNSQPGSIYMKVNKRKHAQCVTITYPKHHCVAINIKLGTIRDIHGSKLVNVLDAKLEISKATNSKTYLKVGLF